jgi:hypothetical protein
MASLEKRNIESPDETRPFRAHGHADVVTLGDFTLGRAVYEPGWRWSQDVKPVAGTESCQVRHTGFCVSGNITVRANDGTQESYGPGDVLLIEPGHDAWVDGDEPCVVLDTGMAPYAKPGN